jgi:hypothetical protein
MVPLAEPRALTAAERALLEALVGRAGHAGLRAQADTAIVDSVCSCGCPSVGLRAGGPALSAEDMLAFSGHGRDDVFGIHAHHDGVDVVVHVLTGRLDELEVYAGDGETPDLPSPGDLADVDIY